MRPFEPCVYLLAKRYRGALYTGVTSDLIGRIHEHRERTFGGYTAGHDIKRLVWFERHDDIEAEIRREKTIKRWRRQWKFNAIDEHNADWRDVAIDFGFPPLRSKRKLGPGTSPG